MKVGMATFSSSRYISYVGVGRYEESLIPELEKLGVSIERLPINRHEIGIHPVINRVWVLITQYFSKPKMIKDFDLIHASSQFTATRYTDVVTVHDLIGMKDFQGLKQNVGVLERNLWRACLPLVRRSKHIIAVSNVTKKDLIEIAHIPENKITVVYNGIDTRKFYPVKNKEFKDSLGEKPVLIYVGELRPYKNVQLILKAMSVLRNRDKIDTKLLLIGKPSQVSRDWWESWSPFIIKNNLDVEWLKGVDDDLLRKYYSNADLFVWPSLAEGFGLPPLEAMACGTNVVALDNNINREILDEMASFSQNNPTEFATAIKTSLDHLKRERDLIEYAKKFNWRNSAKETYQVYSEVIRHK